METQMIPPLSRQSRDTIHLRLPAMLSAIAAAVLFCGGCAMLGMQTAKPVTVPQVVQMSKAGFSADEIIRQMKASGTVYRLQASQLAKLKEDGVADAVINHMQQTYLDAVKRDASYEDWRHWSSLDDYWYGGVPYGWPHDRVYIMREREEGKHSESKER